MKTLALLALIVLAGWGIGQWRLARQMSETIRQHELMRAMTPEQVRQSLGEPNSRATDAPQHEYWYYRDRVVEFVKGRVIDSRPLAPANPHGAPASSPHEAPTPAPRPMA